MPVLAVAASVAPVIKPITGFRAAENIESNDAVTSNHELTSERRSSRRRTREKSELPEASSRR